MTTPGMAPEQARLLLDYVHEMFGLEFRCLLCGEDLEVSTATGVIVCHGTPEIHSHAALLSLINKLPPYIPQRCADGVLDNLNHDSMTCLPCTLRERWTSSVADILNRANLRATRRVPVHDVQMIVTRPGGMFRQEMASAAPSDPPAEDDDL